MQQHRIGAVLIMEGEQLAGIFTERDALFRVIVAGREDPPMLRFQPGSIACLESDPAGGWEIVWMLRPELLG